MDFRLKNIKLFALVIIFNMTNAFEYQRENSGFVVGETCNLVNGKQGVCENMPNCDYVKELYRSGRTGEIVRCQFLGKVPVVCCPKSIKFENALCKDRTLRLKVEDNIINGQRAGIGEFPFQVALGYQQKPDDTINFRCGGSLIADDIVLTAAHCVNRNDDVPVVARMGRTTLDLGDTDDDTEAQEIKIQTIKTHPKYSKRTGHNDIALLKLEMPVTLSDFVHTICLSSNDNNLPEEFTITGFGRVDPTNSDTSNWLLKGNIGLHSREKCKETFRSYGKSIVDSQLCAFSYSGVGSCHGDSGGPMSYKIDGLEFIYGIISYGIGCGTSYPLVYTKVNAFLPWIQAEMTALE